MPLHEIARAAPSTEYCSDRMVSLTPDTDWVAAAAAATPDAVALVTDGGDAVSYGDLNERVGFRARGAIERADDRRRDDM